MKYLKKTDFFKMFITKLYQITAFNCLLNWLHSVNLVYLLSSILITGVSNFFVTYYFQACYRNIFFASTKIYIRLIIVLVFAVKFGFAIASRRPYSSIGAADERTAPQSIGSPFVFFTFFELYDHGNPLQIFFQTFSKVEI